MEMRSGRQVMEARGGEGRGGERLAEHGGQGLRGTGMRGPKGQGTARITDGGPGNQQQVTSKKVLRGGDSDRGAQRIPKEEGCVSVGVSPSPPLLGGGPAAQGGTQDPRGDRGEVLC